MKKFDFASLSEILNYIENISLIDIIGMLLGYFRLRKIDDDRKVVREMVLQGFHVLIIFTLASGVKVKIVLWERLAVDTDPGALLNKAVIILTSALVNQYEQIAKRSLTLALCQGSWLTTTYQRLLHIKRPMDFNIYLIAQFSYCILAIWCVPWKFRLQAEPCSQKMSLQSDQGQCGF